ncbi:MAG: sulfatase/phosphatase domain-containing protein, partial [Verrucomicrobiota bacterium]
TALIFTSDHGDMRMEHGQWLKNCFYEGSARVPLIVAGPGIKKGNRVKQPVSLIDIYPTLMDLAGAVGRDDLSGYSLVPAAHGKRSAHPGVVMSEYHSNFQQTGSFMLRKDDWKYIRYIGYRSQLFNVKADPEEIHDLIDEEPDVAAELDRELENIVDCEAVDAAAKATDAAEFATWKLRFSGDDYLRGMASVATVWNKDIEKRFAGWVENQGQE